MLRLPHGPTWTLPPYLLRLHSGVCELRLNSTLGNGNFVVNPVDILSKQWGHAQVCAMLRPLFFCEGDTLDLIEDEKP